HRSAILSERRPAEGKKIRATHVEKSRQLITARERVVVAEPQQRTAEGPIKQQIRQQVRAGAARAPEAAQQRAHAGGQPSRMRKRNRSNVDRRCQYQRVGVAQHESASLETSARK